MPVYRPNASVRLIVRLDEGRATAELLKRLEAPSAPAPGASGAGTPAARAEARAQVRTLAELDGLTGGADPAIRRALEQALARKRALSPAAPASGPIALTGQASDGLSVTIGPIPVMHAEIERSSFRTGDKARLTLSYWDAPFDARLVRSAGIEIVMGIVSAEAHDAGMHGFVREDGSSYATVADPPGTTRETHFVGFVDKWDIEFGEEGATVRVQAEDLMALLRDTPLPPDLEIAHDVPIEQGVSALLEAFPALRKIRVVYGPPGEEQEGPVPGTAAARRKKLVKKGKKRVRRNAENTNVWDHVTDVCVGTGLIPVVEGVTIRITHARTLLGPRPEAPRMVWGRNLRTLSFARTLAGYKNPTVEVRSYVADRRRTFAARYPDPTGFGLAILGERDFPKRPGRASRVTPAGEKADDTIRVVVVHDVRPEILGEIARGIHEETARQEIEGSFATHDPMSFGRELETADLLDLRAGDPIALEIDTRGEGEVADSITRLQSMPPAARADELIARGFRRAVAVAYAVLLEQAQLQTIFRVAAVRLTLDHEEGLEISVDFQNYITLREGEHGAALSRGASRGVLSRAGGAAGPQGRRAAAASAARRTADARARAGEGAPAGSAEREAERAASLVGTEAYSEGDAPAWSGGD